MKPSFRILLSLLAVFCGLVACAPKMPPPSPALTAKKPPVLSQKQASGLRQAESLKRYSVGRYRDPRNPRVMHEAHDLYRIERSPRWNFHPQRNASDLSQTAFSAKGSSGSLEKTRLKRQLQQERASNRALRKAHQEMKKQITPLAQAVSQAKRLATENQKLRQEIETLSRAKTEPQKSAESSASPREKETPPLSFEDWLPTSPQSDTQK